MFLQVGTNVQADVPFTCFTLRRAYFKVASVLALPLAFLSAGRCTLSSLSVLISSLCVSALADCSLLQRERGQTSASRCPRPRPFHLPLSGATCPPLSFRARAPGHCPAGWSAAFLAFPSPPVTTNMSPDTACLLGETTRPWLRTMILTPANRFVLPAAELFAPLGESWAWLGRRPRHAALGRKGERQGLQRLAVAPGGLKGERRQTAEERRFMDGRTGGEGRAGGTVEGDGPG